jgi:hypothetical protein
MYFSDSVAQANAKSAADALVTVRAAVAANP